MTFRLPFQIFRAVSKSRPSSPNKLFKQIQRSNLSSFVDINNNTTTLQCSCSNRIKQNVSSPSPFLPRYSTHRFRSTTSEPRKNLENRKKVRKQNKCFEKKCVRKIAFRQTAKEECCQCIGTPVPDKCPELRRLKPAYDDSKLKWNHENCPIDLCLETPRMDDIKGLKTIKKKLPKLLNNDCAKCAQYVPTKAPKLVRPKKQYDPSKLEQDRNCEKDLCNIDPPRMDNVRGYEVKEKKLPKLFSKECIQCLPYVPTKAPKLVAPPKRYDPYKMEQKRNCETDLCNIDPPRMDDVVGVKVKSKVLPKLPESNCVECVNHVPTYAPKLVRLKKTYDPNEMKWKHKPCKDFCDDAAPRMDDVRGVKVKKRTLPKLKVNKCKRCAVPVPKSAPKLVRPKKMYNDKEMKWHHKCPQGCEAHPPRSDDINGCKTTRKTLPKLIPSKECTYCRDVIPTISPELVPPKKIYDDKQMKWQHDCPPQGCDAHPPRSDDVKGYKVESKKLKPLVGSSECCPCTDILHLPSEAPKLCRPKQMYDPSTLEQDRNCDKDLCNIDPPRMDDVVGLKVKCKVLPKLPESNCVECVNHVPTYAPKLVRLKKTYDPNEMKWKHKPCKDFCDDASPRMDDVLGLTVTPKELPKIPEPNNCKQCVNFTPKYAPELKRPKRNYDPHKLEKSHCRDDDLCDLDPPRMDDVRCWKPKKKILPSFISNVRRFSTLTTAGNRMTYPIYSPKNYTKLRQYSKKNKKRDPTDIIYPSSECSKACPKFKCPGCKPAHNRICFDPPYRECTKTESPYNAYSDCMDGWYEDPPSECINWNEVLMQPCKQVSGPFYKLSPPPPKWAHVDPSVERKCIANKCPDPPVKPEEDNWVNPCPTFKSCGNRARKYCPKHPDNKRRPKLKAPYKSFSEQCPQFPEVEMSECDLASKYAYQQSIYYTKNPPEDPKTCYKEPLSIDACKTLPDCLKEREMTKCGQCNEKKPPCPKKKSSKCKAPCCNPPKSSGCKPPKKPKSKCDNGMNVEIQGKKYKCVNVDIPESKMKCGGPNEQIKAMVCTSQDGDQKYACVCKSVADPCDCKSQVSKSSDTKSCPKEKGSSETMMCSSKNSKKKMVCVCKPIPNCESKGKMSCSPKKVSPNFKCCPQTPSKPKCKTSSNSSCCGRISDMKSQEIVCRKPTASNLPIRHTSPKPRQSSSLWDRICTYFRAREGCPGPNDWKQKDLEEKARKAAAAAGLELLRPQCKYIQIDKCRKRCPKATTYACCPKIKKSCQKPKKESCCKKPTQSKCPKPQKKSCCTIPKQDPCSKPKNYSCCSKQIKDSSSNPDSTRSQVIRTVACRSSESLEITKNSPRLSGPVCRTDFAIHRHFSTYSKVNKQMKKKNNQIITNQNNVNSKLSTISNISPSYLRLNNNYVGRICKLKFGKIGVRNSLIRKNPDEEPFTICHICKVIPRHEPFCKENHPDSSLKLKLNSERRRTYN